MTKVASAINNIQGECLRKYIVINKRAKVDNTYMFSRIIGNLLESNQRRENDIKIDNIWNMQHVQLQNEPPLQTRDIVQNHSTILSANIIVSAESRVGQFCSNSLLTLTHIKLVSPYILFNLLRVHIGYQLLELCFLLGRQKYYSYD